MRYLRLSIVVTLLLVLWSASNIMWSGEHHRGIIKADGKGYYAHLPALFIYSDFEFAFLDSVETKHYYNPNFHYEYRSVLEDSSVVNKYYCGTAIPLIPGFLVAHAYAKLSHFKDDGFSKPYNISVSLSAIIFMLLSMLVLIKVLRMLGILDKWIAIVLPTLVFGSNWYYYVVCEPAVSHVYSVFFITYFVYLGLKWGQTGKRNLFVMAAIMGLIVLIRPVNGIFIFIIPFFFTSFNAFLNEFRALFKSPFEVLLSIIIGIAIVSLQLMLYKLQTGSYWVYSYQEEGFNFLKPQILNILLSYKKGLFLYTPITLVALLGLYFFIKERFYQGLCLTAMFLLFTYVVSSWWNWYYGGSFSSRVYLDFIIVFAIPLAFLIQNIKKPLTKKALIGLLLGLVLICQFQTYQYRRMIIHWDGMDKAKYWEVFLDVGVFKR